MEYNNSNWSDEFDKLAALGAAVHDWCINGSLEEYNLLTKSQRAEVRKMCMEIGLPIPTEQEILGFKIQLN